MKKILSLISSAALALALTFSATAAPTLQKKSKAAAQNTELSVAGKKLQQKAPAKAAKKPELKPKFRGKGNGQFNTSNLFRSVHKNAGVKVRVPYKVGARVDASIPEILGSVTYSDPWMDGDEFPVGLYTVPTSASEEFELKFLGPNANYGGVAVDGVYYVCDVESFWGYIMGVYYIGYDMETGEEVFNQDFSYYTSSMTYDSTSGTIYAIAYIEGAYALVKLSFDDAELGFEPVDEIETDDMSMWNSIACDASGQLWGIAGNYEMVGDDNAVCVSSTLYKINKVTGATTKIGDTGFDCTYMTDATFDLKTNKLYWTICPADETGLLAEVNTATGEATVIYQFPDNDEVTGLYVAAPKAEDDAPDAVTNAKAEFSEGSLTGTISFTAPTTFFNGTPATGALTFTVLANGEKVAEGNTTFGAEVSKEITLGEGGSYTFQITVANEAGNSPATTLKVYVGKDTPAAPAVEATYNSADNTVTLSWTAVTGTVNGGYMDAAAVTYTVTRFPDEVVVAENITETTATDELPEVEGFVKYFYEVTASCDGLTSAAGVSGNIVVGSGLVPPFVEEFSSRDAFEPFTIIDANGDNKQWGYDDGNARILYNSTEAMDDWLISPPIKLKAGLLYDVLADIWAQGKTFPERIEVKLGKSASVAGMTTVLLEPTVINQTYDDPFKMSVPMVVDADGEYFIGFHGISDPDSWSLNIDNFGVSAPRSADAPAAVTDLEVVADPAGALSVAISFVAPDKAISGEAITSLEKIELSRDEEVIKTWDAPAPGATLSFTDTPEKGGNVLYSVVAYNADGAGLVAEASTFVGFDLPAAPTNVTLVETANPGEVTIAWDAVTTDIQGNALPASEVTYQVYILSSYYRDPVSEKISDTSFTLQAVDAGEQDFVQYAVFAYTSAGEGDGEVSPFKPVGTPYTSFSLNSEEDLDNYIVGINTSGGGSWGIATNETFSDVTEDADGTNFFLYMRGSFLYDGASIFTGKIDLSETAQPGMTLYVRPVAEDDINIVTVSVTDIATDQTQVVRSITVNETGDPETWNKVTVDLKDYAQKTVMLTIYAEVERYSTIAIDGWKVVSLVDNDLIASKITAPATVACGADYNVDVTVANDGVKDATEFTVALYADGEKVAEKSVESLASGAKTTVSFEQTMGALATEPVEYYAEIVYTADQVADNNTSATIEVAPKQSNLPAVTDLSGELDENGYASLSWSEPDLTEAPADAETVSFEDGDSWAQEYEGWTFVDVDGEPVGGIFSNWDIPGIVAGETPAGIVIFDFKEVGTPGLEGHTGNKYLASIYRDDNGQVDDWAISPLLSGQAQTISFWAKSANSNWPEALEMYYSTGSLDPDDFQKVGDTVESVPGVWTEYSFDVPAGATHFAVRSCGEDAFMLMLDDFTFAAAGAAAELSLVGYDVYRDGEKITDEPIGETEFVDEDAEEGSHTYVVVTVYDKGISAPSNAVTVDVTGISEITFDANDNAEYFNLQGIRVLNPEKGGLYIRKTQDGKAAKVGVK